LLAHGLSTPIKLLPDTVRFFPELCDSPLKTFLNGELAYEIDPAHTANFAVTNTSYIRRLFFLERNSSPGCHFVPCRPEYVRDFFLKSVERIPEELTEAAATRTNLIQLLSACPSWMIRTGESPQRTAGFIKEFLDEADHATA
jgi:hypothetical protein